MIPLTSASSSSSGGLLDSIIEMPGHFVDIATHDPMNAVLIAVGTLFFAAAMGVFAYLSAGALLSVFTVEESPPRPGQAE